MLEELGSAALQNMGGEDGQGRDRYRTQSWPKASLQRGLSCLHIDSWIPHRSIAPRAI